MNYIIPIMSGAELARITREMAEAAAQDDGVKELCRALWDAAWEDVDCDERFPNAPTTS